MPWFGILFNFVSDRMKTLVSEGCASSAWYGYANRVYFGPGDCLATLRTGSKCSFTFFRLTMALDEGECLGSAAVFYVVDKCFLCTY